MSGKLEMKYYHEYELQVQNILCCSLKNQYVQNLGNFLLLPYRHSTEPMETKQLL